MPKLSTLPTYLSPYSFSETVERLKNILKEKNIQLFAIIEHSKEAEKASLKLDNEQLFIFGDPKIGTYLMQENPQIGIELPLKVLIWQDKESNVQISYKDPLNLIENYGIEEHREILIKMSQGLSQLMTKLAKKE